ncbi:MAG: NifU family protein [Bacteroidia bacterium]|jgi:Fe-S cluster biogenesis protein NfuA|nr:NifU family protein [Bacteroidia bacterium]
MLETIELKDRIEKALDTVRPYLQADGGDVELVAVEDDMVVKLRLLGACRSCDISHMTMKAGIENTLKSAIPEIKSVEAIDN